MEFVNKNLVGKVVFGIATVAAVGALGSSTGVVASISNTGPDSTNVENQNTNNSINATNSNSVFITNINNQSAISGDSFGYANTNIGNVSSGSVTNTSSTSTVVSINNRF